MIEKIVFVLLSILILVPAAAVVTTRNVFHAGLWLVLSLTGVAGLFALLGADFLFVVQLLLYAGGITVLLLFVVLLSGRPNDWVLRQANKQWGVSLTVSAVLVAVLAVLFRLLPTEVSLPAAQPTTASLGFLLIRDMLLPFEAVSLALLAALIGAVHFTAPRRKGEEGK